MPVATWGQWLLCGFAQAQRLHSSRSPSPAAPAVRPGARPRSLWKKPLRSSMPCASPAPSVLSTAGRGFLFNTLRPRLLGPMVLFQLWLHGLLCGFLSIEVPPWIRLAHRSLHVSVGPLPLSLSHTLSSVPAVAPDPFVCLPPVPCTSHPCL